MLTPPGPLLACRDLHFAYRGEAVLNNVSVDVQRGEVVALMGASGSGKTTLLSVLAGLVPPSSGCVLFAGQRYDNWSDFRRAALRLQSFGVVFQRGDLIPELSVGENVELPLRLLGRSRRDARRRAEVQLAELGIDDLYDRTLSQISGGQSQRVAVARALAHDPEVMLADEPTGALDESTGRAAMETMLKVVADRGMAAVVITHDANVATMCHRQLYLKAGHMQTPTESVRG